MGNTIRLNNKQPVEEWLTMSNIGTDIFLELIINAASTGTFSQNELISYLREQKEINEIAPGTASLDIDEMPWNNDTMCEDVEFLIDVVEKAKDRSLWEKLGLDLNEEIVIPRFDQYIKMLKKLGKIAGV